jgi:type IV secretion system protein VirB2
MKRPSSSSWGFALCSGFALALLASDAALAQQFQPIGNAFSAVLSFLQGTVATTVATIAVIAAGFAALTGRIPWFWFFGIVVGVALIFGASSIITALSSSMAN